MRKRLCGACGEIVACGRHEACPKCGSERPKALVVECCGESVVCDGFTNTCEACGSDFNHAGQRLAPRAQWGEETGESPSDILLIP